MKRLTLISLATAALIGAAFYAFKVAKAEPDRIVLANVDSAIVTVGESIYNAHCASCHGADLEGQPDWQFQGDDGRLPAPPHDETGHTWHHDGDTLFRLTKYGVGALINDPDYASNMPVYEDILSDNEIIAVLSYIKSTWPDNIRARHDEMENRK